MLCEKCGAQNESGAQYCGICGSELPPVASGTGFFDIFTPQEKGTNVGSNESTKDIEKKFKGVVYQQKRLQKNNTILLGLSVIAIILAIIGLLFPRAKKDGSYQNGLNQDQEIIAQFDEELNELESRLAEIESDLEGSTVDNRSSEGEDTSEIISHHSDDGEEDDDDDDSVSEETDGTFKDGTFNTVENEEAFQLDASSEIEPSSTPRS